MLCLCVVVAATSGCTGAGGPTQTRTTIPSAPLPTYAEAVRRYNDNARKIDRIWSRAVATIEWTDLKDKRRVEQGDDCFVVYVAPDHFALSVGKLGTTLMWAGCDAERYWVIDAQEPRQAYVGRRANVGRECTDPLPMIGGVNPRDVMRLMAVEPIDPGAVPVAPTVEWHEGRWMIEPPGASTRLHIDPATGLATRIDLLDAAGRSRLICKLSNPVVIESHIVPAGGPAKLAGRMEIELPDGSGSVRLTISSPGDGRADDRIDERLFDFDRIRRVFKIGDDATTLLDHDCDSAP
ncbi:MAG: hypothetical protein K8S99_01805 [Planctomycetes bacterium]|nr:hypothetical protein [Planctomycetota bacterium]